METYKAVRTAQKKARLARDKFTTSVLTTLLGALETQDKRNAFKDDNEVVTSIRKFKSGVEDNIAILTDNNGDTTSALQELEILEQFLPQLMDEVTLAETINQAIEATEAENMSNMGKVMGWMKANFPNRFDGGAASKIIKARLS